MSDRRALFSFQNFADEKSARLRAPRCSRASSQSVTTIESAECTATMRGLMRRGLITSTSWGCLFCLGQKVRWWPRQRTKPEMRDAPRALCILHRRRGSLYRRAQQQCIKSSSPCSRRASQKVSSAGWKLLFPFTAVMSV